MPALWVRFAAAILLGVLYQFYYGGGDTFVYHTHGSTHIYNAFSDSFLKGIKLLFASGDYISGTYEYASKIWYYRDPSSYYIIKIAAFFDLLTLNTYSATALFFAAFSFIGLWALYQTFYQQYKKLHFPLALATLFIPSVVFWGSGILKDTITLGALGLATYFFFQLFIRKKINISFVLGLVMSLYLIYNIKIYIILTLIPAFILWWVLMNLGSIKSFTLKLILLPVLLSIGISLIIFMVDKISIDNPKYALDNIAETVRITAYDIGFYTGRDAGSGYSIGELDGSIGSMIALFPEGVNVTLFRPYLWEVNNPLMLFSALESVVFMILTFYVLFKMLYFVKAKPLLNPLIIFLLCFSIIFAFAVGVSTFNFGTLARYKIPLLPLYASALVIIMSTLNKTDLGSRFQLSAQNNL